MKLLVTGAKGLLGSEVVEQAEERGHEVVEVDITKSKTHDLRKNSTAWSKLFAGCDAVIHLAAYPHPRPHVTWQEYLALNTMGTVRVAEACLKHGVKRLVNASSVAVYGIDPALKTRPIKLPIPETHPYMSQNTKMNDGDVAEMVVPGREQDARDFICYSQSKVMAEQAMVQYAANTDLKITMLRLTTMGHNGGGGLRPEWLWLDLDVKNAAQAFLNAAEQLDGPSYLVANVTNEPLYPEIEIEKWTRRTFKGVENDMQPMWAALDLGRAHRLIDYKPEPRPDYQAHVDRWGG